MPSVPLTIDALGPSGPFTSRTRTPVVDVTGEPVAELSLVPTPFVTRAMSALRRAETPELGFRLEAIRRAGEAFASGTVAGLDAEEYALLVSRISGLGITEVRSAVEKIAHHARHAWESAQFARPQGVAESPNDPATLSGAGIWIRRGDVFAVHAAGNHPAIHGGWLQALALGYRVAVRPSRREPLTPYRLVLALREAGFGPDQVVFLPTDHNAADEMLIGADLSMAYGGQEVMDKYRKMGLKLLPQGPGRSKMLVAAAFEPEDLAALIADSAARGGGTGCTNVTAVLVEGGPDRAEAFATAIADRLGSIPSLPPEDERAILPVHPVDDAEGINEFLKKKAVGAKSMLGGGGIVDRLGDGSAALRPAVHLLTSSSDVQSSAVELAFPCVWVAPWKPDDGVGPLRNTLNLVVTGDHEDIVRAAIEDRSIRNVYVGERPSYFSSPSMPHDGYLADFLMQSKGFVR